jgi:gamma-glutamyltranspeptidase / glutathione hydrolase
MTAVTINCVREMAAASGPRAVSSAHHAATSAGIGAYAAGGNAFDAALAACFMEGVALPMKCGLGGDLVALFRRAGGPFEAIVSVGPGALALADGEKLERIGPRSVGVPGAPDGYMTLHRFCRLGLDKLTAPAIAAAEVGVPWSRVALNYYVQAEELLARWSPNSAYAPDGKRPALGSLRRLPGLGALLRDFVKEGAGLFAGPAGDLYLKELQAKGGILTKADLATRPARLLGADITVLADGTRMIVTPEPTSGQRLVKLVTRACETPEPLVSIVRAERGEARRIGRLATDGGTSVVTAADSEGNVVVVLHSNSFPQFASGVVLSNGLILTNRPGRGFDLAAPSEARNAPRAGRVPPTTLHAWALERPAELLAGATPGGINQLPWNAQTVTELLAGTAPVDAVTNPRWALTEGDELSAEPGAKLPDDIAARAVAPLSQGSAQQILRIRPNSLVEVVADPRAGGSAQAYY